MEDLWFPLPWDTSDFSSVSQQSLWHIKSFMSLLCHWGLVVCKTVSPFALTLFYLSMNCLGCSPEKWLVSTVIHSVPHSLCPCQVYSPCYFGWPSHPSRICYSFRTESFAFRQVFLVHSLSQCALVLKILPCLSLDFPVLQIYLIFV